MWHIVYCTSAALRIEDFSKGANEDLDDLTLAVDQLRRMWPTADVFYSGFCRLRPNVVASDIDSQRAPGPELGVGDGAGYMAMTDGIDWTTYFPFATPQTSVIASRLLVPHTEECSLMMIFLRTPYCSFRTYLNPVIHCLILIFSRSEANECNE